MSQFHAIYTSKHYAMLPLEDTILFKFEQIQYINVCTGCSDPCGAQARHVPAPCIAPTAPAVAPTADTHSSHTRAASSLGMHIAASAATRPSLRRHRALQQSRQPTSRCQRHSMVPCHDGGAKEAMQIECARLRQAMTEAVDKGSCAPCA